MKASTTSNHASKSFSSEVRKRPARFFLAVPVVIGVEYVCVMQTIVAGVYADLTYVVGDFVCVSDRQCHPNQDFTFHGLLRCG